MAGVFAVAIALGGCGAGREHAAGVSGRAEISFQAVPDSPFGVATTPDGRYAFVDLVRGRVLVYSLSGVVPRVIGTIRVPGEAVGCSITRDGRLLLIASGQGATVVSVARAERGRSDSVLGSLTPPPAMRPHAGGAIETASSADGRFVFVSLEYGVPGGVIAVYDLGSTAAPRFAARDYIGAISLGDAVVGSALSPDGRYLYVTSELVRQTRSQQNATQTRIRQLQSHQRLRQLLRNGGVSPLEPEGTLSVINVATAERDPAHAVLATVAALHEPVRVAVSPDGSVVWVTARASDRLLAFSTAKLLTNRPRALLAEVTVGTAPVGVAIFDHGDRVIVADSNRFNASGAHAALTIVDARAAIAHRPSVIATLPAGQFPRELALALAVEHNDTVVLVTNFASNQLEAVNVAALPQR